MDNNEARLEKENAVEALKKARASVRVACAQVAILAYQEDRDMHTIVGELAKAEQHLLTIRRCLEARR